MRNRIFRVRPLLLWSCTVLISGLAATSAWATPQPIDTNAPYYPSSGLGTSVLPDFQGGTLRIDQSGATYNQDFTVENFSGNTIDFFGHSVTLSGVLSGAGGLTLRDSTTSFNRLTLTGSNTYTGLTTLVGSTLVVGNGGTTGSIAGDVTYEDAVWICNGQPCVYTVSIPGVMFNRSDTIVYSGNYLNQSTGSGTLFQAGTGTLVLTGTVTSLAWITNGGTIQIGNGGTTGSIVGNIFANGTLAFNRSDAYAFAGTIWGTGAVRVVGGNNVILTGNNTYAGGTTIQDGILQIGSGGTTGSILGDVVDNGTLVFDRYDAYTFAGTISGTGAVQLKRGNNLVMAGNNTYTGGTTVIGSTLQIGNGGTLEQTPVNPVRTRRERRSLCSVLAGMF